MGVSAGHRREDTLKETGKVTQSGPQRTAPLPPTPPQTCSRTTTLSCLKCKSGQIRTGHRTGSARE
eukprot:3887991-Rhodomonas_salina.2